MLDSPPSELASSPLLADDSPLLVSPALVLVPGSPVLVPGSPLTAPVLLAELTDPVVGASPLESLAPLAPLALTPPELEVGVSSVAPVAAPLELPALALDVPSLSLALPDPPPPHPAASTPATIQYPHFIPTVDAPRSITVNWRVRATARLTAPRPPHDDRSMSLPTPTIATPCHADWHAMSGDSRARHCARCDLRVIDLSELPRPAAAAALRRPADGRLCVRYSHHGDGALLTRSDPQERLVALLRGLVDTRSSTP